MWNADLDNACNAYGITLTGRERMLLEQRDAGLLTSLERQERFLLQKALEPLRCPLCRTATCVRAAAVPGWDPSGAHPDDGYQCPGCTARLVWQLAVNGTQSFALAPDTRQKVADFLRNQAGAAQGQPGRALYGLPSRPAGLGPGAVRAGRVGLFRTGTPACETWPGPPGAVTCWTCSPSRPCCTAASTRPASGRR